ncbi:MAG TPA: transcription antitermination factor NusB [Woeseiaceae bacterium]|nr:transcription antitermination factor NusB [Woeseiaceae bacterium]
MSKADSSHARRRARELLVQALYQRQLAGHDRSELMTQFRERPEYERADREYFDEALRDVLAAQDSLEAEAAAFADRPLAQLDPVERGILLLGLYELRDRVEIPFRVVINEGVNLARRFGAEDGHKYVNAVLDRAAMKLRHAEHSTHDG